jgi:hypothetical protein
MLQAVHQTLVCLILAGWPAGARVAPGPVLPGIARAIHPISVTQIDAFVTPTRMTLRCAFYADDLEYLHDVEPDLQTGLFDADELRVAFDEHAAYLLEKIDVFNAAGDRLEGKLVEKGPFDIPEGGVESMKLMDFHLNITFEYELPEPPEFLTFRHDITDPNFTRPTEVSLTVKQAGSDAVYGANMKGKTPETIRFDWENPLSKTATGEELKQWFDRQRDETLGLTNYGGVYAFIYITPFETRLEVLIPVGILASEIRIPQADPYYVEVEEQQAALESIRQFFLEATPLKINGQQVAPRFDRIDFGGLDIRDFAMQREPRRISVANGRVGVIMSWPTRQLPDSVEATWTRFNEKFLRDVDVVAFTPDETIKKQFSVYLADNSWTWKNPGLPPLPDVVAVDLDAASLKSQATPLPLFSIGCAGLALLILVASLLRHFQFVRIMWFVVPLLIAAAFLWNQRLDVRLPGSKPATLSRDEAAAIFDKLIHNMFRSFDYSSGEDIYDSLSASISGPLLEDVYLKMRKSLEIREQGGAIATIDGIEIVDGRLSDRPASGISATGPLPPPGFAWHCQWNLTGTVEHWGHVHQRTNRYDAIFNVQNVNGQWKFTDYETIDEKQGPVTFGPRKL